MTKDQIIVLLKKYKENKARLKLKLREKEEIISKIDEIRNISISAIKYDKNSDIHSKNVITDKVGNQASNNIENEIDLKTKLIEIEKEIKDLILKIEQVDIRLEALKYKEKEMLIAYYIDGYTYEDIGNRIYYRLFNQTRSTRNIQDIVERATKKLLEI